VSERGRAPGKEDLWRTRRVLGLYATGESIPEISRQVGWSEGRVRKVLRASGVVVTEVDGGGSREE
jgi:hypothetical protein